VREKERVCERESKRGNLEFVEAAVDDVLDAVDRQRRLRDIRRNNNLRPNRRFQVLDLYWCSPEPGVQKSRLMKRRSVPSIVSDVSAMFVATTICEIWGQIAFSRSRICTGARQNPAACGKHQGGWNRRFDPSIVSDVSAMFVATTICDT